MVKGATIVSKSLISVSFLPTQNHTEQPKELGSHFKWQNSELRRFVRTRTYVQLLSCPICNSVTALLLALKHSDLHMTWNQSLLRQEVHQGHLASPTAPLRTLLSGSVLYLHGPLGGVLSVIQSTLA